MDQEVVHSFYPLYTFLYRITHLIKTAHNMTVKDKFRKLATNKFIPDLEYNTYKLSFQTVFYTCDYKYCCCPCAFDHEWLVYISDSGEINEELFKKVEANILAGKCPHVDHVISDYVTETAVYGIHLAAAVGTEKAVTQEPDETHVCTKILSAIFHLSPYILAVFKKNVKTTALLFKTLSKHCKDQEYPILDVVYPERSMTDENVIELKDESLLEFCVRNGNKELFRTVLQTGLLNVQGYRTQLATAIGQAIKCNYVDTKELIKFLKNMSRGTPGAFTRGKDGIDSIIVRLVILDKPDILEKVLKMHFQGDQILLEEKVKYSLTKFCAARVQDKCYSILCKYKVLPMVPVEEESPYVIETYLQVMFHLFDEFPEIMTHGLEKIPGFETAMKSILSTTNAKLFRSTDPGRILNHLMAEKTNNCLVKRCRPVIKWILQQNIIVDTINTNNQDTLLISLLESKNKLNFRPNLEILLHSNLKIHSSIFKYCLKVDENVFCKRNHETVMFPQRFITDAREHSVHGHNDGSDYVLEFTLPLLLECGYNPSEETLGAALCKNLHPDVLKYIKAYIDTPRSLKIRCRDVLRGHFKGRRVHRFVEMSQIPPSIKDFILLKTILTCV